MSLNFRPYHNDSNSKLANFRFYSHLLLVLLGFRPSISSHMRGILYPTDKRLDTTMPDLKEIADKMPGKKTTATYLTFCDGDKVVILEKDHRTAVTRQHSDFGIITNHDTPDASSSGGNANAGSMLKGSAALGMQDLLDESADRRNCIQKKWDRAVERHRDSNPALSPEQAAAETRVSQRLLTQWLRAYPITNEETHYSTIMDPRAGQFVWVKRLRTTEIYEGEAPPQLSKVQVDTTLN